MLKPSGIKKVFSYVFPVVLARFEGQYTQELEVRLEYGKIVLNSQSANYSFGSLHRIWRKAISKIEIYEEDRILVLGGGTGSIRSILHEELGIEAHLTMVEADEVVLDIGSKYFGFIESPLLNIVHADAFEYCGSTKERFDLIIIDVFIEMELPNELLDEAFWQNIDSCSAKNSTIILNTIIHNEESHEKVKTIRKLLSDRYGQIRELSLQDINHLFLITH